MWRRDPASLTRMHLLVRRPGRGIARKPGWAVTTSRAGETPPRPYQLPDATEINDRPPPAAFTRMAGCDQSGVQIDVPWVGPAVR